MLGALWKFLRSISLTGWIVVGMAVGIVVLRKTDPDIPRPFRTPWVPLVPILSVLFCLYLMLALPLLTWLRFFLWMAIGATIYFFYGRRHSRWSRSPAAPRA